MLVVVDHISWVDHILNRHRLFCQYLEIVDLLEANYLYLLTPCLLLHIKFYSNYFFKMYSCRLRT